METTVTDFMKSHQVRLENKTIVVGVCGGPDSMALLHILTSNLRERNMKVIAVSIDHQLRGDDSKADVTYVGNMCKQWGIQFVSVRLDVQAYAVEQKIGTQVAARELRYEVFAEQMKKHNDHYLSLGHHWVDHIEILVITLISTAIDTRY